LVFDHALSPGLYADRVIDALRNRGREVLDQAAELARAYGVPAESVLCESIGGAAGPLIVEQAEKWTADLIVMGTHGRRGLRRLALGSDAERVLRAATVPVLLVRDAPREERSAPQGRAAA